MTLIVEKPCINTFTEIHLLERHLHAMGAHESSEGVKEYGCRALVKIDLAPRCEYSCKKERCAEKLATGE